MTPVYWWHRKDRKREHIKAELYVLQSGLCPYCKQSMSFEKATLDRVLPHALGGCYSRDNLVMAHFQCNRNKGDCFNVDVLEAVFDYSWLNLERLMERCFQ